MGDLFFTLLLYHKAKERRYKFYDCLVAHEGAYIDLNRFVEPTDMLSVTYKIAYDDALEDAGWAGVRGRTQQFIACCRTSISDTNGITLCAYPYYPDGDPTTTNVQRGEYTFIDNGDASQGMARRLYPNGFDKKIVVEFTLQQIRVYCVNTETLTTYNMPSVRSLTQGQGRALLKLFAGFEYAQGMFAANGCDSRIYSFNIKNANDVYTVRLQPAEDLSTGKLGMYDSINDKFYPNKNSVGYFTVEENITDKIILDVESQIDTKRLSVYCTSYNMPYQLSDGKLMLVRKHDLPPITDGFIDLWNGMGKQSDEEGIFYHTALQRNQTGDVTYIDNADGSVSVSVPNITGHGTDFTRWAYKLANVAVGSIVIVGKCNDGFVIMNYSGDTPSSNGSLRWYTDGRIQNNITEDYEDANYSSIFTANNPHTYTASGNAVIDSGGTLIGAVYNGICNIKIYGMALYTTILTKEQLLEVAQWLDRYVKRPQAATRSLGEELQP